MKKKYLVDLDVKSRVKINVFCEEGEIDEAVQEYVESYRGQEYILNNLFDRADFEISCIEEEDM